MRLFVHVVDPRAVGADASLTVEAAARCIEHCTDVLDRASKQLPENLVAFSDNTVRENKNVTTLHIKNLEARPFLNHRVGHSHGPLEQILRIMWTALKYVDLVADGEDAVQAHGQCLASVDWSKASLKCFRATHSL